MDSSSKVVDPLTQTISERLDAIKEEIRQSLPEDKKQRESEICIIAVSKTKSKDMIIEAYKNGMRDFGENYVHEILTKSNDPDILKMCPEIQWHFIGHLQTNKAVKLIHCPNIYMLQCIDSVKLAHLINKQWLKTPVLAPLKVMIQVNTSNEPSKSGVSLNEVDALAKFVVENCRRLEFCGFMTIGSPNYNTELGPNPEYQMLVDIRDRVAALYSYLHLELSMGMSKDFLHAIQLGSSYVRIGERIFGPRQKNQK